MDILTRFYIQNVKAGKNIFIKYIHILSIVYLNKKGLYRLAILTNICHYQYLSMILMFYSLSVLNTDK